MLSERSSTAVKSPNFLVTFLTEMNGLEAGSAQGAKERLILPSDFIIYPRMIQPMGTLVFPGAPFKENCPDFEVRAIRFALTGR
ncbi:hypothetical protein D3C71_1789220 [compost metagenome]